MMGYFRLILLFKFWLAAYIIFAQSNEDAKSSAIKKPLNAIKFDVLSPLNYFTGISYERKWNDFKTMEATIGIIGLGKMPYDGNWDNKYLYKANGVFLKFGLKKIVDKGFCKKKSVFNGIYYKPEIGYAFFNEVRTWNINVYTGNLKNVRYENNIQAFSVIFKFGHQFSIRNRVLIDLFGGAGVCFDNRASQSNQSFFYSKGENNFIALRYFENNRISINYGINLGYIF